jgi:hypothetical protein
LLCAFYRLRSLGAKRGAGSRTFANMPRKKGRDRGSTGAKGQGGPPPLPRRVLRGRGRASKSTFRKKRSALRGLTKAGRCSMFVLMEVETLRGALAGRCICAAPTAIGGRQASIYNAEGHDAFKRHSAPNRNSERNSDHGFHHPNPFYGNPPRHPLTGSKYGRPYKVPFGYPPTGTELAA